MIGDHDEEAYLLMKRTAAAVIDQRIVMKRSTSMEIFAAGAILCGITFSCSKGRPTYGLSRFEVYKT
ncbi:hypothetical protein Hanom_Chr02g00133821 [Helianthus anomalus]